MKGIFTLDGPKDLLKKLEHDYDALKADQSNPYLAFNFFVTAEHLLDWIYPGRVNKDKRTEVRNSSLILQICSHIANGAKHFVVEDKHHNAISGTGKSGGAESVNNFETLPDRI